MSVLRSVSMSVTAFAALAIVAAPVRAQTGRVLYRVPVSGMIELGLAPFIERSIDDAERAGALAVILDMDTPGGRVDAAERIADAIADAEVPVYAFVNRRAFSAGALISLATNRIYMRPGSVIGAATPVDGSGTKASEKIVSAMRSEMRALAEARGLDPAVAEAMVDESIEITGVVAEGKLLTLTTEEAVAVGYAEQVDDLAALLEIVGASGADIIETRVNWAERIVRLLSHPVISPFLLSLGFLGLLIEIKTPGLGLAGAAGLLSLSLFFGSHLIIGLAGMEELLIIGAGSVLVAVEVFVIPGFGLFGVLGGAGILGGLYMSLVGDTAITADLTTAGWVLTTTVAIILVTGWAILKRLPHSDRLFRSRIFLASRTDRETGYEAALARPDLVGSEGVAITDLRPSGTGLFLDERLDVVSESEWIEEGTPIRVVSSEGYRHVVRPFDETT
ncbi:MAG: nodulation protein NfeD [Gemmatimonadota bacterium]|nr:MAG: nodulation protein NfeD [Gemmatimonadota bacterium]